jgi:hypothetical protein
MADLVMISPLFISKFSWRVGIIDPSRLEINPSYFEITSSLRAFSASYELVRASYVSLCLFLSFLKNYNDVTAN